MRALSLCLPVLLLSACAGQPAADAPAASPTMQACNAEAASGLVGQPATPTNVEAARLAAGAASVRALGPSDPMTLDFRGDRLNVIKDAAGAIAQVRCG
ncbi:I78 family peptidase inhibitor [Thermomonas sp.]|uniref:I78 family peptidase inhibitor n=1 Tax=Thermomonas sp. TaxID=1971895 RepID=UPI0026157288|nr:I78 family peptidase inhibitor [Thermomonas sp.]MCO5056069.1 I78 family peptidase inhibitor [Thermomonas sp.]